MLSSTNVAEYMKMLYPRNALAWDSRARYTRNGSEAGLGIQSEDEERRADCSVVDTT